MELPSVPDITKEGKHSCAGLILENARRISGKNTMIHIFEDLMSCKWNMKIGLEFIEMDFCPFCGSKLC